MQGAVEESTLGCPRPNALGRLCAPRFSWAWFSWASSHLVPGLMQLTGVAASGPVKLRRFIHSEGPCTACSSYTGSATHAQTHTNVLSARAHFLSLGGGRPRLRALSCITSRACRIGLGLGLDVGLGLRLGRALVHHFARLP